MSFEPFKVEEQVASPVEEIKGELLVAKQPSGFQSALVGFLVAVVLCGGLWLWSQGGWKIPHQDEQKKEQVEPSGKVAAKDALVAIVEETADRKSFPHIAIIQADKDLWDKVNELGTAPMHFYDVDSPNIAEYAEDARKAGLPALIVVSADGVLASAINCPPTSEAIADHLNKVLKK